MFEYMYLSLRTHLLIIWCLCQPPIFNPTATKKQNRKNHTFVFLILLTLSSFAFLFVSYKSCLRECIPRTTTLYTAQWPKQNSGDCHLCSCTKALEDLACTFQKNVLFISCPRYITKPFDRLIGKKLPLPLPPTPREHVTRHHIHKAKRCQNFSICILL